MSWTAWMALSPAIGAWAFAALLAARELVDKPPRRGKLATAVYAYGGNGQVESVTAPDGRSVRFEYDAAGRLVSRTESDGRAFTFEYDESGRLASIRDVGARTEAVDQAAGSVMAGVWGAQKPAEGSGCRTAGETVARLLRTRPRGASGR